MNKQGNSMNKKIKITASVAMLFALITSTLIVPAATAVAVTDLGSTFGFQTSLDTNLFESSLTGGESGVTVTDSESNFTECALEASRNLVTIGESINLSWYTSGFDSITVNGQTVSNQSGTMTISNLQESTAFTLQALSNNGSTCTEQVIVTCVPEVKAFRCEDFGFDFEVAKYEWNGTSFVLANTLPGYTTTMSGNTTVANWTSAPAVAGVLGKAGIYTAAFPGGTSGSVYKSAIGDGQNAISHISLCGNEAPKQCELTLTKSVNKTTAVPGDLLTYTITIKNTGDANCSGGGVKIVDVVDQNVTYQNHTITSNFTAGYGSTPVYTSSNRTLYFNGNTLVPGESGTITWTGKVNTPTQCGDFEVHNQAKATAAELNNYQTWAYSQKVTTQVDNDCYVPKPPVCTLVPSTQTVGYGGSAVLTWTTDHATVVTLTDFGSVALDGTVTTAPLYTNKTYTLLATGPDGQVSCTATVTVIPEPPAPTCTLLPATQTTQTGGTATFTWTTTNADTVTLTSFGSVALNGTATTAPLTSGGTYELVATGNGKTVSCTAAVVVETIPAPSCDSFTASPSTIMVGSSSTLMWESTNAATAFINNGIGAVAVDGSVVVTPLASLTYQLTLIGVDDKVTTCSVPVTVTEDPVPVCELFTATPNSLPVGGGAVALNWKVLNAETASISPLVGAVSLIGSQSVNVTQSTTFTLTAIDGNGDEVSCTAPVAVADPAPVLTCAANVSFSASDTSIDRGDNTTLTWSTTDVDTVSISTINATALSGSQSVSPTSDITYVLTATRGSESVNCPLSIDVSSGGGGGGSVSPRCEMTISDKRIKAGEEVTIEWDTTNATEVTLFDDRGKVLFTTDDYLSTDKKKYYDHEITLKPTRDTEYTLLAERSSRDDECTVKVEVIDDVVVLQTRTQDPLVAGISLSQVPYTGFEAGPFMTMLFYTLLVAWSLFITYLLVTRKHALSSTMSAEDHISVTPSEAVMSQAEAIRPDAFVKATVVTPVRTETAPKNLPIGPIVVGYENLVEEEVSANPHQVTDEVATELENRAHQQKALLSSDAVRHLISTTKGTMERRETLDAVIVEAKKTYPLEDGWIVINESRMRNLCEVCAENQTASAKEPFIPAVVPEGAGSLAEAIVTGNVVAAYSLIGNRPMFALADAAADLDAVYRNRKGGRTTVSELLTSETKKLSDEQIKEMISALTSALDGTYTDEASAVKMAIMKAVKVGA